MFKPTTPSDLEYFDPSVFKHPIMLRTSYDTPERDKQQYEKGLEIGKSAQYVAIATNGVWTYQDADGTPHFSSEIIGYHASTAALLQGFLDSGAEVYVSRLDSGDTKIQ